MPPRKKAATGPTPVEDLRHDDTRANIPTGELAGFVPDEQAIPPVRYARDPSLDPQLVWRGKDEQDSADLEVPSVPIYVQEKVVPRAIVEDLRRAGPVEDDVPSLFDDFDGLDFGDKVDFYAHEANWSNRMILGDSLLAMTSLAEREGLRGKVQMIYVDPPYGIRFGSNWQVSTRKREVKDGKVEDATRQPEQVKAFRDTWDLGIHSYLAYLRDRLVVARGLLTDSGSIFVQIGDENVHLVRSLMDEVLGSENFVSQVSVQTTTGASSPAARTNALASVCDYVIWYAKDREQLKYRQLLQPAEKKQSSGYRWLMFPDGTYRGMTAAELRGERELPAGARTYKPDNIQSSGSAGDQKFVYLGKTYRPGPNSHWKASLEGMGRLASGASYEQTVLDNLKKAGVQNGWRSERLTFDRVEPFAGQWIQAVGHAVGEPGSPERVGIALGPQYGTVDADLVQQAAKEAVRGAGLDLLLVCGFAFDPRASEKAKEFAPSASEDFAVAQGEQQYGRLPVLLVRVNPDLAMGDALLKATGAGNLFTVFGEPDIALERTADGLVVEIRGLDVYDPTTGTVRSSTTDDIACWFIDTDYDEESFFVKHAYFTGADEPYAKLQRALRAEVDEEAWASLYRTRSRAFPLPSSGKIAVKVVNHYGDEVLQVYDVR